MARPKKPIVENTAVQNVNLTPEVAVVTPLPKAPLDEIALSYHRTSTGWAVSKIMFNAETGQTSAPEVIATSNNESEALHDFKITVATELMQRNRS